jgi:hypothetical protein
MRVANICTGSSSGSPAETEAASESSVRDQSSSPSAYFRPVSPCLPGGTPAPADASSSRYRCGCSDRDVTLSDRRVPPGAETTPTRRCAGLLLLKQLHAHLPARAKLPPICQPASRQMDVDGFGAGRTLHRPRPDAALPAASMFWQFARPWFAPHEPNGGVGDPAGKSSA